jgi:arylmalonate decarboxylase
MSAAIVDGLRAVGAKRVAVATAYTDVINRRLAELLEAAGLKDLAVEAFNLSGFGEPGSKSETDIIALSEKAVATSQDADGILISCGGLRTLGVAKPLEERCGIPVVSSTPAAFWSAMRLVGESGHVPGRGLLLEQAAAPVH